VARISVVGLAVGEGQLHGFGDGVDVLRGVVAERGHVEAVQDLQHLDQHGPLAPEAARDELAGPEGRPHGRLEPHAKLRQVFPREQPALGGVIARDRGRDVAAIEGVAGGGEARHPAGPAGGTILVGEVREGATEVGLDEALTGARRPASGQEDRRGRRPPPVRGLVVADDPRNEWPHREAVPGALDRRLRDLREPERAEVLERRDPRIRRAGHDRSQEPLRHVPAAPVSEVLERGAARPDPQPGDRRHGAPLRLVEHDRGDSRETDDVRMHDAEADTRGDPGVDRIAARLEDPVRRQRGQRMAGGDGVVGAESLRAARAALGRRARRCVGTGGRGGARMDGPGVERRSVRVDSHRARAPTGRLWLSHHRPRPRVNPNRRFDT
jgi:hypothetical protein